MMSGLCGKCWNCNLKYDLVRSMSANHVLHGAMFTHPLELGFYRKSFILTCLSR